jgi:hypothetical protein
VEGSDGRALLEVAYKLFVCREARLASGFWTPTEAKEIKYAAVRGTFAIQLGAFMMIIDPKHAGFAEVSKGKSGFYKCVNEHKRESYGGDNNLSTKETQGEVKEVLRSLQSKGRVCKAWLDQNGCRGWRSRNSSLKNDLIFWDKGNGRLFLQFRYRELSKGRWKIQLYYRDGWCNYSNYWVLYHHADSPTDRVKLQKQMRQKSKLSPWLGARIGWGQHS